jgi:hypothetical protein
VSQHGRRAVKAEQPPRAAKPARAGSAGTASRRFGPISAEGMLVLTLIGIIAAASMLVNQIDPGRQRTQTTVGATQYKTHTLGTGGIQPGDIQARTITPVHIAETDRLSGVTSAPSPKPIEAKKAPKATGVPTAPPSGSVGTGTGTGTGTSAGTGTGTGTGSGSGSSGSGSGNSCSPLGGLLGGCQTKPAASAPQPASTPPAQ